MPACPSNALSPASMNTFDSRASTTVSLQRPVQDEHMKSRGVAQIWELYKFIVRTFASNDRAPLVRWRHSTETGLAIAVVNVGRWPPRAGQRGFCHVLSICMRTVRYCTSLAAGDDRTVGHVCARVMHESGVTSCADPTLAQGKDSN